MIKLTDIWRNMTKTSKIAAMLVVITIFGLAVSCNFKSEVRPAARQLIRLVDIIHRNFQAKPDFWKLDTNWLVDNNMVPQEMLKDTQIVNALGNPVLVGLGIDGQMLMPGARSFDIVYKDLSKRECVALASYNYPQAQTLGLISLTIVNGAEEKMLVWGEGVGLPLSTEEAAEICQKRNILIWNFE